LSKEWKSVMTLIDVVHPDARSNNQVITADADTRTTDVGLNPDVTPWECAKPLNISIQEPPRKLAVTKVKVCARVVSVLPFKKRLVKRLFKFAFLLFIK